MNPHTPLRNLFLLVLLFPIIVFSQIGSAETQVNIVINQVQSIEVSQPSVSINMNNVSHFLNGNSSGQQVNHVKVISSAGYQVTAKASTQHFSLNGSVTTLPVNTVAIKTTVGNDLSNTNTAPPSGLQVAPQASISTSPNTIITSPTGEYGRGYNVEYSISAQQSPAYLNRTPGAYTTTVMYTLVPQ